MGSEYRLHVDPRLTDLEARCDQVCASSDFRRIATSLLDIAGVGIQLGDKPADPTWPHVADLHVQPDGAVYVLCHNAHGEVFMRELVKLLRGSGRAVVSDDDV